jgi:single-stranded-DNA-specific exonuclease
VHSGEPVLVVSADARRRAAHLRGRLGGFALVSWDVLEVAPAIASRFVHVVALDPPGAAAQAALVDGRFTRAWGEPEVTFAALAHASAWDVRAAAGAVYRALRGGMSTAAAIGATTGPAVAGRALRVLADVGLVVIGPGADVAITAGGPTELERSAAFRAFELRRAEVAARFAVRVPAVAA